MIKNPRVEYILALNEENTNPTLRKEYLDSVSGVDKNEEMLGTLLNFALKKMGDGDKTLNDMIDLVEEEYSAACGDVTPYINLIKNILGELTYPEHYINRLKNMIKFVDELETGSVIRDAVYIGVLRKLGNAELVIDNLDFVAKINAHVRNLPDLSTDAGGTWSRIPELVTNFAPRIS